MSEDLPRWLDEDAQPAPARFREAAAAFRTLGPDDAQLARMLAQVETASALGAAKASWLHGKLAKLALAAVGTTATLAGLLVLRDSSAPPPTHEAAHAAPSAVPVADEPPSWEQSEPTLSAPPRTAPRDERNAPSPAAPTRPARPRALRADAAEPADPLAELALLQRARRVLARDPARALALTDEHAHSHPRGAFAEERELLAIEALLAVDRRTEAEARAVRFARAHPHSVHAHRLAVLLAK